MRRSDHAPSRSWRQNATSCCSASSNCAPKELRAKGTDPATPREAAKAGYGAPHLLLQGGKYLNVYNADAAEVRVGTYGNLVCVRPGHNANIQLDPATY